MPKKRVVLKRDELYKEVWKSPMTHVASKYGISSVALKKICKKMDIPTPPRGYWARVQHGQRLKRAKLHKLKQGTPERHEVVGAPSPSVKHAQVLLDGDPDMQQEVNRVQATLKEMKEAAPHRYTGKIEKALRKAKPDKYGRIHVINDGFQSVAISPKAVPRALKVIDALLSGSVAAGYKINAKGLLTIDGVELPLKLFESCYQRKHIPSKEEKKEIEKWPHFHSVPKWDYVPSGILEFSFSLYSTDGFQKQWNIKEDSSIQAEIEKILLGSLRVAKAYRIELKEREEREKRWEEERRREEEEATKRREEQRRLTELEEQAENWSKAEKIRCFTDALEKASNMKNLDDDKSKGVKEWLAWARKHADRLDPIIGSL